MLCLLSSRRPFWPTILWWIRFHGKPCAKLEMRRSASLVSEREASSEVEPQTRPRQGPSFSSRTVNRLSRLLNHIIDSYLLTMIIWGITAATAQIETQNCEGTQNTGEVVSLWQKEGRIYYCSKIASLTIPLPKKLLKVLILRARFAVQHSSQNGTSWAWH